MIADTAFGCVYKRDARLAMRNLYLSKMKNSSRLGTLSDELDNLPMVSMRLGYPADLLSLPLLEIYERAKTSWRSNNAFTGMTPPRTPAASAIQEGASTQPQERPAPVGLALMDGKDEDLFDEPQPQAMDTSTASDFVLKTAKEEWESRKDQVLGL